MQTSHPLFDCIRIQILHARIFDPGALRQSTGVVKQVTDADLCRGGLVSQTEPWEILLDGCVQLQPALLNQLHDGQGRHGFSQRGQEEGRLRRDRAPRRICDAVTLEIHDLIALNNGECQAGDALLLHPGFDIGVHGGEVRTGCVPRAGGSGRPNPESEGGEEDDSRG